MSGSSTFYQICARPPPFYSQVSVPLTLFIFWFCSQGPNTFERAYFWAFTIVTSVLGGKLFRELFSYAPGVDIPPGLKWNYVEVSIPETWQQDTQSDSSYGTTDAGLFEYLAPHFQLSLLVLIFREKVCEFWLNKQTPNGKYITIYNFSLYAGYPTFILVHSSVLLEKSSIPASSLCLARPV